MHGHSFRVVVWLDGAADAKLGFVRHFADIETEVLRVRDKLDHHVLNEIGGLENPTLETISGFHLV